jgi:hypothetical protein
MRFVLAVLITVLASAGVAQEPFGRDYVLDTRYGNLQIVGGPDTAFVFYEGLFYEQVYGHNFAIRAAAGTADTAVDWVLLERIHYQDACRTRHLLLAITPEGLTHSREFGPCDGEPTDMQVREGQVQVTITDSTGSETVTFNGEELHEGVFDTAPPALANIPARMAESANVTTGFGRLWVQSESEWDQVLLHEGTPIAATGPMLWIRSHYEGEGRDWVIASSNHRGNMCGGWQDWFLIQVSDAGAVVAPPLNACNGITDVRIENNALVLDMTHGDLSVAHETFTWDGITLTSVLVPQAAAIPAGAGADVTRWIGRNTWEMFEDASERARMGTVMSPEDVQELAGAMSFGSQFEQRGDWVVAQSCQRHNCGFNQGVLAIRISDGAVAAALMWGSPPTITGFGPVDDPVVAGFINEHVR